MRAPIAARQRSKLRQIANIIGLVPLLIACTCVSTAQADLFGSGANTFEIEFVAIGDPGNLPDANPNPAGAVPYSYRIGKYEISEQMINKANAQSAADGEPLGITIDARDPDKPATSVTWYEAARFVNWLNTSTGSTPAYKFDSSGTFQLWEPSDPGYNPNNLYRNRQARYFLPSIDEWHKAAYYDPIGGVYYDYPTGSDAVPDGIDFVGDPDFDAVFFDGASNPEPNTITDVGLLSPFGTASQGGNVFEWEETAFDRINDVANDQRRLAGGAWASTSSVLNATNTLGGTVPHFEGNFTGFRVAEIPEPSSLLLVILSVSALWFRQRNGFRGHS